MRFIFFVLFNCLILAANQGTDNWAVPAQVKDDLARAIELEHNGQIREAEHILLEAIRQAEAARDGSLELALVLNNLAVLYTSAERPADAERHFKRSIRILETHKGDLAEQMLARTKLHLATLYLETGRLKEAEKLDLPMLRETLESPEDKVRATTALASLATARKQFKQAEQTFAEVLSFWMEPSRAAASQSEIATTLNNLGILALWQGQNELARERLEQSFAAWQRVEGPAGPTVIKSMSNIGTAYLKAKQYNAAATWLARAMDASRKTFGELHPFSVGVYSAYADALKGAGRRSEAQEMARTAAQARRMMRSPSIADYTIDYREKKSEQQKRR